MKNRIIITVLLSISMISLVFAQDSIPENTILTKKSLTGNWGGGRTWLSERGIILNPRYTSFYQGIITHKRDNQFEFGSKLDAFLNIDFWKMKIWKGFSFVTHVEYNFGKSINNKGGTLIPQNTALILPGIKGNNSFDITSVFFSKEIGKKTSIMLGKFNMIDIASGTTFTGGAGINTFQNIAFTAPPSGILPPYIIGSIISINTKQLKYTFMVYDPVSVVNKTGLEAPFSEGITFYGGIGKPITIKGKKGTQNLKIIFSTQNGTDLEKLSDVAFPKDSINTVAKKNNRFYISYSFQQYFIQNTTKGNALGTFFQVGLSDGNPNFLDNSILFGLAGTIREKSNWGVGFYHYSISNSLKDYLKPNTNLRDENGIEAYYNINLTPWVSFAVDYQMIFPLMKDKPTAHFFGFRSSIKL